MAKFELLGGSYAPACAGRSVLDHVMSRWGTLVLLALHDGTYRFSELRRRVGGVSEKMLSQTLRLLEEDGFVLRRDYGEVPPRVEYELTAMGKELAKLIAGLGKWIAANTTRVLAAREEHHRAAKRSSTAPHRGPTVTDNSATKRRSARRAAGSVARW